MTTIRCWVKLNDEMVHDETFVNDLNAIDSISYPGLRMHGDKIEVGFTFDPPLLRTPAAEEPQA